MSTIVFAIAFGFALVCSVYFLIACAVTSLTRLIWRSKNPFPYAKCLLAATLLSVPSAVLDITRLQTIAKHNTAATAAIYKADGDRLSQADLAALEQFGSHTRKCNNVAAAMLRDLNDPSLSPEKVPQTLDRHLTELQAACDDMSRSAHSIENAGAGSTCRTMASLFTRQKDCWIAIRDAVLAENPDAEEMAYAELARVTEERQVAGREFLDRARKWIPPDSIDQALEARRRELIEKMKVPE